MQSNKKLQASITNTKTPKPKLRGNFFEVQTITARPLNILLSVLRGFFQARDAALQERG